MASLAPGYFSQFSLGDVSIFPIHSVSRWCCVPGTVLFALVISVIGYRPCLRGAELLVGDTNTEYTVRLLTGTLSPWWEWHVLDCARAAQAQGHILLCHLLRP